MMSPAYVAMPPAMSAPMPNYAPAPNRPPVVPAGRAAAAAPSRPLVRAKAPDEATPPRPAPLVMPSPQELGVAVRLTEAGHDSAGLLARVKELGIVSYHMETLPDGRCRFTCWLPREQPGLTQRIEALAATEAEAMRLGLERAGQCRVTRP
jgi:hypothetical protein